MPYEKAKEWSEKSIKMSEYIAIFGEPEKEKKEEKEKSIPLHITLPSSKALKLRKAAKDANMTLSEYINFLIG
jgi:LPS O-antigen subunit length determinant protein (WzzB/FepE family)